MDLSNIKCIVISGGGAMIYHMLGIMNELITNKKINIDNVTSFYGSSSGAIISLVLSLGYDITDINNYFLDRPWDKLVKTDIFQLIGSFTSLGIISKDILVAALEPLLKGKDLSMNTTLKELYEFNKKDIHIFATNITDGISIDLSHETYPDWTIIEAIQSSVCIPGVIQPLIKDNKCFVDGCVVTHFPIMYATKKFENNEILGIRTCPGNEQEDESKDINFKNIFDFFYYMIQKTHSNFVVNHEDISGIDNIIDVHKYAYEMVDIFSVLNSKDKRYEYFREGKLIYDRNI